MQKYQNIMKINKLLQYIPSVLIVVSITFIVGIILANFSPVSGILTILAGLIVGIPIAITGTNNGNGLILQIKLMQRVLGNIAVGIVLSIILYFIGSIFSNTVGLVLSLGGAVFAVVGTWANWKDDHSSINTIKSIFH